MSHESEGTNPGEGHEGVSAADELLERKRDAKKKEARARRLRAEPFQFGFTSLLDALIVVLMFLLITIGADPLNVTMDERLLLATSNSTFDASDAIPIIMKKDAIMVDTKSVVRVDCRVGGAQCTDDQIKDRTKISMSTKGYSPEQVATLRQMKFSVDKSYKEDGEENSFVIIPLVKALEEKVKNQQEENKELRREFKAMVNIICDRDLPFRMVAEVVHSAGLAGLSNMRFAVIKIGTR